MNHFKKHTLSFIIILFAVTLLCTAASLAVPSALSAPAVQIFAAGSVKAPVASVKAGTYTRSSRMTVELSCDTSKAKIYYCIGDGKYQLYDGPVAITKTSTLKAYAVKSGVTSETVSYKYKLVPKVSNSKASGVYENAFTLKLTSKLKNVKIYYTLDGTKPSSKTSAKYTSAGIKITSSCQLRILVKKSGWTSKYTSYDYEIRPSADFEVLNDFTQKPLYKSLSANEQKLYAAVFKGLSNHDSIISGLLQYNVSQSRANTVMYYILAENPQFYWVNDVFFDASPLDENDDIVFVDGNPSFMVYKLIPEYTDSVSEIKSITPKLQTAASAILAEAQKTCKTDFDYIRFFHDAVITGTTYDSSCIETRSFAGTNDILVDGHGLCTGYARAFAYLCQLKSIPCVYVTGEAHHFDGSVETHCWNKVFIDGSWYTVDPTWDDDKSIPVSYAYLGLSDDVAAKNHTPDDIFNIDAIAGSSKITNLNYYFTYNGYKQYVNSEDTLKAVIDEAAARVNASGELHSGDVIYTRVYFWSGPILSKLRSELENRFWSMFSDKYPTEYYKLYMAGARSLTSYGHNSVQVTIIIK